MGQICEHRPALLLLVAFSRHSAALQWTRQRAEQQWGPIALASELFPFVDTQYYEQSMGTELMKQLLAFQRPFDPGHLADIKRLSNAWEAEFRQSHSMPESRPLNLDPGYLTEAKLVLATTKDRNHRIYLCQGIYAEVTLHFQRVGGWQPREWTYPDYRSGVYHPFLSQCREHLRLRKHDG